MTPRTEGLKTGVETKTIVRIGGTESGSGGNDTNARRGNARVVPSIGNAIERGTERCRPVVKRRGVGRKGNSELMRGREGGLMRMRGIGMRGRGMTDGSDRGTSSIMRTTITETTHSAIMFPDLSVSRMPLSEGLDLFILIHNLLIIRNS